MVPLVFELLATEIRHGEGLRQTSHFDGIWRGAKPETPFRTLHVSLLRQSAPLHAQALVIWFWVQNYGR